MSKKYAAINTDENLISTEFHDSEEAAWSQLEDNSGEPRAALESAYYVQAFSQQEIDALPEVDI